MKQCVFIKAVAVAHRKRGMPVPQGDTPIQDQSCRSLRYDEKNAPSALHPAPEEGSTLHLAELERGEKATVIGVAQGEAFCHLCSLGLNSGAQVELVRTLSRKTVLIVRVDGFDIALRGETAATVKIRPEQHA